MEVFVKVKANILPLLLSLILILLLTDQIKGQDLRRNKRTVRSVAAMSDKALQYLGRDMSDMKYFKEEILAPFNTVRVSGTPENKIVQEHIKTIMTGLGWHVDLDRFTDSTPFGDKEFTNIIATFNGNKTKKIVLACHFDSKYYARGKFTAATDSAVPCAILLETARQLNCLMLKGPRAGSSVSDVSLQLVFFDGEEAFVQWTATDSIYGARHLANKWDMITGDKQIANIRELILLDLIGTSDTSFRSQFTQTDDLYKQLVKTEKTLNDKGYLCNKRNGKPKMFIDQPAYGRIEDDHKPFLDRGVDILHLISTPFPSVWHQMSDNWSNLDFNLIDDYSRIFRVFVSNMMHLSPENSGCRKKKNTEL